MDIKEEKKITDKKTAMMELVELGKKNGVLSFKEIEEALTELELYLDKARVMRLPSVRIIHGYGTGRLQKAIHEYLKKLNNIEYHFGGQYDGGMGSTIVEFEKKVN